MVPVSLSLTNFLSYGEPESVLDFSLFHVACISGRNGQGKSALLDAITWALWGEARKSSGGHKPDEELLRIGTTRMVVAFVFDIEAERYRVTRTYQRSASGKSSKATLEFQALSNEGEVSLTEASMRQTQERLITVLGLEYSTFINASFLLQGRSDEFTKKKPADRKSVLTRILGLDRYTVLQNRAKQRAKRMRDEITRREALIDQFGISDEEVSGWKSELDKLDQEYGLIHTRMTEIKEQVSTLSDTLAKKETLAAVIEEDRKALGRLEKQLKNLDTQRVQLQDQIEEATTLTRQKEAIEGQHTSYLELLENRNKMDESQEAFRIASRALLQAENQLASLESELQQSIIKCDQEIEFYQNWLQESSDEVSDKEKVIQRLDQARNASNMWSELRLVLNEAGPIREELAETEKKIASEKSKLETELGQFREKVTKASRLQAELKEVEKQHERLHKAQIAYEELEQERARLKEEGVQKAQLRNSLVDQAELVQESIQKVLNKKQQVENTVAGLCPTCGQELTPAHKKEVLYEFDAELGALESRYKDMSEQQTDLEKELEKLRTAYKTTDDQLKEESKPGLEIGKLAQKEEHLLVQAQEASELAPRIDALEKQLVEGTYAVHLYQTRKGLREKLAHIEEIEKESRDLEKLAAEIPLLEKQVEKISSIEEKKKNYLEKIEETGKQRQALIDEQKQGDHKKKLQRAINEKKEALESIGFDSEAYSDIKGKLEVLREVPGRMQALRTAEASLVNWKEQVEEQERRREEIVREKDRLVKKVEDSEAQTEGVEAMRIQLGEIKEQEREATEAARVLTESRTRLTTYIDQAKENQKKKKNLQEELVHIRKERKLYFHLVDAFGKNGIPSLIIEQTLPDIEDKANLLLHRLTEGRMRVRLETLRNKKSGGTQETLEIVIIDDQGVPRPYETFSGGEAFRVNFALRIALSQILAERSGVRIRTLCIDEGFGTQDEEGVQNMIEAIQTIQQDFDKILVITHLDILKEAFPVRIEVHKDPAEGSVFEVLSG